MTAACKMHFDNHQSGQRRIGDLIELALEYPITIRFAAHGKRRRTRCGRPVITPFGVGRGAVGGKREVKIFILDKRRQKTRTLLV